MTLGLSARLGHGIHGHSTKWHLMMLAVLNVLMIQNEGKEDKRRTGINQFFHKQDFSKSTGSQEQQLCRQNGPQSLNKQNYNTSINSQCIYYKVQRITMKQRKTDLFRNKAVWRYPKLGTKGITGLWQPSIRYRLFQSLPNNVREQFCSVKIFIAVIN